MAQLFKLAANAHNVVKATTETPSRATTHDRILLYLSSLNYTLLQQRTERLIKVNGFEKHNLYSLIIQYVTGQSLAYTLIYTIIVQHIL